jgi:hypothetical protein
MSKASSPVELANGQVREITKRLDAIIRLLATSLPENMKQKDKIRLLSESGLQPKEIGPMLGITAHNVSVVLQGMKESAVEENPSTQKTVAENQPTELVSSG